MMHDKYGREIKQGDVVVAHSWPHGKPKPMHVLACNESTDSCNVLLDPMVRGVQPSSANAKECVLAVKEDGTIVPLPAEPPKEEPAPVEEAKPEAEVKSGN